MSRSSVKSLSFYVTGEEISELLNFLPGESIRRVLRAEDPEQSELYIFDKYFRSFFEDYPDFYALYQFSFILPPPRFLHINVLKSMLKHRPPRGIIFLFDPKKPVGYYQALIERLFNYLIDALGYEFESTGPFDITLLFGVVLINFDSIDFDYRAANKFLLNLYPILQKYTDRMRQANWFEGIFTTALEPLKEVKKILNKCVKVFYSTKLEKRISIYENEYKMTLKSSLDMGVKQQLSEIPLKHFTQYVQASTTWILRNIRNILSTGDYPYKLFGNKVIAINPGIILREINQIEEEIKFLTINLPKTAGILNYLIERSENLKNIIQEGFNNKLFSQQNFESMIANLFKCQDDLQNLLVRVQFENQLA